MSSRGGSSANGGRGGGGAAGETGADGSVKDSGTGATGGGAGGAGSGSQDGGGGGADAPTGTALSPYKGVSFTGTSCADLDKLGATWFYDWGTSSSCKTNAQFVPMVWGGWSAATNPTPPAKLATAGAKIILGFNEPDHADQSNLTVTAALALWSAMDQPGFERWWEAPPAWPGGRARPGSNSFMTRRLAAVNLRVDFIRAALVRVERRLLPGERQRGSRATSNGPKAGG